MRQGERNRNRIAEISVPACPIPTQNTKVVMYTLQKIGGLYPAWPSPSLISIRKVRTPTRKRPTAPNNSIR